MNEPFESNSRARSEGRSREDGANAGSLAGRSSRNPWEERLSQLLEFRAIHGHCNVPRGWRDNPSLSYWVINQRYALRKGTLTPEKVRRLAESGVAWTTPSRRSELRAQTWFRMYLKLSELKTPAERVPGVGERTTLKLKRWLANQRYLMRAGLLPEDRRLKLEALGMLWDLDRGRSKARDAAWERMYLEARKLKKDNGGRHRDERAAASLKLARWLAYQRRRLRRNKLSEDRRRRLLELGLGESPEPIGATAWQRMYSRLQDYRAVHGHCGVPRTFPENPSLGRWVARQRSLQRSSQLGEERKTLLDRIGFDWSLKSLQDLKRAERWNRMFRRLLAYRSVHGHTRVPRRHGSHQALADWVARQRQLKKSGQISDERMSKLARIGFDWDGRLQE